MVCNNDRKLLPANWTHTTIGEIALYVQRGKSPQYTAASALPVINQKCIRWSGIEPAYLKFVDPSQWLHWGPERFLQEGDVLWNSTGTGTIGRAAIYRGLTGFDRAVVDSHVTIIRTSAACDYRYLNYFIMSPLVQSKIEDMQSGSTNQVELSRTEVVGTMIPLAPLAEQRRIVAKIEELFSDLDAGVETLKAVQQQLKVYRQAVLKWAFEGKLTEKWREQLLSEGKLPTPEDLAKRLVANRTGKSVRTGRALVSANPTTRLRDELIIDDELELSELPAIPDNWFYVYLAGLGDLARGKSKHRPRNAPELYGGPYPFVQTGDIKAANGTLRKFSQTYSESGLKQSKLWPTGTLCITIAANIADTCFLGIDACFPDSVVGFTAYRDLVEARYVEYFIRAVQSKIEAFAPATAQKNINLGTLENLVIPYCSTQEQCLVIDEIDRRLSICDELERSLDENLNLIVALRQSILKKAFEGKLVPQDPNDEPAEELLKRIADQQAVLGVPAKNKQQTKKKSRALMEV